MPGESNDTVTDTMTRRPPLIIKPRLFFSTTPRASTVIDSADIPTTHLPAIPATREEFHPDTPTMPHLVATPSDVSFDAIPTYYPTVKLPAARPQQSIMRQEALLVLAILLVAMLSHGFNMFHFPYVENDEGTYMSQAWSVVFQGKLAPYTYWYDHAPIGWLQLALWTIMTGGFHTFGLITNSGRVLMLLMQLGSTFMLYRIARNLSNSVFVASVTTLLFTLSPFGIFFHRRVLLDNICTFWMLLSLLLLISRRLSLKRVWLSAVALGIAVLSKEVAIFLFPAMAYLVFYRTDTSHRWIAVVGWILIVGSIISLYLLMATLNNELFPTGTLLGGTSQHVSLIGTLQYQASRGKDGGLLDLHSGFWSEAGYWIQEDPMLVVVGSCCAILCVLAIKKYRVVGVMGLLSLSLYFFLARGGEVIVFYFVPLLPLLALNIGLVLGLVFNMLKTPTENLARSFRRRNHELYIALQIFLSFVSIAGIACGYFTSDMGFRSDPLMLWTSKQADAQAQTVVWVKEHIPATSRIIVDDYMWTDLYDTGNPQHDYKSAQWFWKVELDPAIHEKVFHSDWRNADYIVTTDEMLHQIRVGSVPFVKQIYLHSTSIARFDTGSWPLEVRKIKK